jgi:putative transposase
MMDFASAQPILQATSSANPWHLLCYPPPVTNYRRNFVSGGSYFFTVNLAERRLRLLVDRVDLLRQGFRYVRRRHPFDIEAIVVLPDHLHTIWTLPENDSDYALRWRLIKSAFSRSLAKGERISPSRADKGERGTWQRRYWEHTLRDEGDFARHADYIHYNPVKHGYASRVRDWRHSSFRRMVRLGVYPLDWAGDAADITMGFGERRWVSQTLNPSYELRANRYRCRGGRTRSQL